MKKETKHITWIDTVKGIGVILVVLGHLIYRSKLGKLNVAIYSFHIPLYFITAGFLSKIKENEKFKDFIKKKFYRILCPALIFILLSIPFYALEFPIKSMSFVKKLFYWEGSTVFNAPCWFFIVLFEVVVIDRILELFFKTPFKKLIITIVFLGLGYIIYRYKIFLPFGLDRAVVGLFFFLFGNLLSYLKDSKYIDKIKKLWTLSIPVLAYLWYYVGVGLNYKVSMYNFYLGRYWCFIVSGVLGTLCFWWICRAIDNDIEVFRKLGQNTVFIICSHYFIVSTFRQLAVTMGFAFRVRYTIMMFALTFIIVAVYLKVVDFINKKWPLLNGKYKP